MSYVARAHGEGHGKDSVAGSEERRFRITGRHFVVIVVLWSFSFVTVFFSCCWSLLVYYQHHRQVYLLSGVVRSK